jgi:hypothetical protein
MNKLTLALAALLFCAAGQAAGQARFEQRAVEEIVPGVFVRTTAGNLAIDVGGLLRCASPCVAGQSCGSVCQEGSCAPDPDPLAVCLTCTWQCTD